MPLNKVPGALIAVGCIRAAMHHWKSRQLVPYFLACPLGAMVRRLRAAAIAPAADHETLVTVPAVPKTGLCPGTGDVIAN
jgi:hypothetical protein